MEPLHVHMNGEHIYDISFHKDFNSLPGLLSEQGIASRRVCIVTESNVAPLYLAEIMSLLEGHCKELISVTFEAGEEHKNLDTVRDIYEQLILAHFDRNDLLVALGGGVTGDITGYVAATYLRGIDFVQVPTTLLSQVDSSIGGKTGVDFDSYKNMVGAFHMPKHVYINVATLQTLPSEQFVSGMGEVIKHGLIKDKTYFDWIVENKDDVLSGDINTLLTMIYISCNIKRMVVEADPTEKGDRALLNFGHTLGHAIEKHMNFTMTHGACVGVGCVLAANISMQKGLISEEDFISIGETFDSFGFPGVDLSDDDIATIIRYTKNDKKMVGDKIKFVLLRSIGDAFIDTSITDVDMTNAFA